MKEKEKTPLYYGEEACKAIMNTYAPEKLPPSPCFFYHQGVFLSGMQQIYRLSGKQEYFDYVKAYVDSVIGPNGELMGIDHEWTPANATWHGKRALEYLDCKQPSILLYDLLDATGDEKYAKVIKRIAESMYYYPVNMHGGYWHMLTQPYQMWLDGAYMAGPLLVRYADRFGDDILRERAVKQIFVMDENMKDEKSGLYVHGWDESKKAEWSDKETGLSKYVWGRALGWYAVAILDVLEYLPENHCAIPKLKEIERRLLSNLVQYQDTKTGLWFNVVDYPNEPTNWVESSCSNLFIYSYARAVRMNIIDKAEFGEVIDKGYQGMIDTLYCDESGKLIVDNVCIGTCIDSGTYEHYVGRPRIKNDLHGMGAFVLMCAGLFQHIFVNFCFSFS